MFIGSVSLNMIELPLGLSTLMRRLINLIAGRRAACDCPLAFRAEGHEGLLLGQGSRASHLYTVILNHVLRCDRYSARTV